MVRKHPKEGLNILFKGKCLLNYRMKPAVAAMHGRHSVFYIGHCTVIHCDAGGVSLADQ